MPPKATVDDDFDDLDDVLDAFPQKSSQPTTAKGTPSKAPATSKDKESAPAAQTAPGFDDLNLADNFTEELAKGMAALMREIAAESDVGGGGVGDADGKSGPQTDQEKAFREAWEKMLIDGMNGEVDFDGLEKTTEAKGKLKETGKANGKAEGSAANGNTETKEDAFQSSIRKAMDKLKESETNLQAESASDVSDPLEALLSQLGDGAGGESEEELQNILESMMTQLMSKEILYEPLKELHEKFPSYLKENGSKLNPDDQKRYVSQQEAVIKILAVFDDPSYSEGNAELGAKVVTLMNEMQSYGSPPPEIMGPLPPGLDVGADGMPKLPDGCTIA
ncbi:unnamed protein product [Somion occarium]|uniref:Pex19-domain-containing protein n=1 Tax=Somion occarium TaxID=3059160 RepID=A0ABP1DTG9_9APHY